MLPGWVSFQNLSQSSQREAIFLAEHATGYFTVISCARANSTFFNVNFTTCIFAVHAFAFYFIAMNRFLRNCINVRIAYTVCFYRALMPNLLSGTCCFSFFNFLCCSLELASTEILKETLVSYLKF